MSKLRFNDGVEFDTSGPFRIEGRHDGLYLVGHGILSAVANEEEGALELEKVAYSYVKLTFKVGDIVKLAAFDDQPEEDAEILEMTSGVVVVRLVEHSDPDGLREVPYNQILGKGGE